MNNFFSQEVQTEIYGREKCNHGRISGLKSALDAGLTTFKAIKATGRYSDDDIAAVVLYDDDKMGVTVDERGADEPYDEDAYKESPLVGMLMALFEEERQMERFALKQFNKGRVEALKNLIVDGLTTFEAMKASDKFTEEELAKISEN